MEANNLFWYRKFWNETRTGQLMGLGSDEPQLSGFLRSSARGEPEATSSSDSAVASPADAATVWLLRAVLREMRVLRWILIIVGILLLIRLWL